MAPHLLIVDDDPGFHRFAAEVLRSVGLSWEAVLSAEDALSFLEKAQPLALIVDGLLPGMRGDELVRRVRARWTAAQLPIVFVSAFFRDAQGHRQLEKDGAQVVLHKPLTAEGLKRALVRFPALAEASGHAPPESLDFDLATAVELLDDFLGLAQQRLSQMRRALVDLAGPEPSTALQVLRREGHKFKGTGTAYGMPELTRLGAQVEQLAAATEPPVAPAVHAQLLGQVEAIAQRLGRAGASVPALEVVPGANRVRLIVVDGPGPLAEVCAEAATRSLPVRLAADAEAALRAFYEAPADVVVVATDVPALDGRAVLKRLAAAGVGPLVALVGDDELGHGLELLHLGAAGLVHRPADVVSLARLCAHFLPLPRGVPVVAVSSDRALLGEVAEALAAEGLPVTPWLRAEDLLTLLDTVRPSAVLLGPLDGVDTMTLLRLVRADARHHRVAVLLVGADDSRQARLAALEAGADEVLARPFESDALLVKLKALLRRGRSRAAVLPGFPGPMQLEGELGRALAVAPRGRTLALLLFEVDPAALPSDRYARDALLARVGAGLRAGFRASDLVAALDGGRFVVLLHDVTAADAGRLLRAHVDQELAQSGTRLRAGAATFPEHGAEAGALMAAASAALA